MTTMIPVPSIGEILSEEFMIPLHLSAYQLAKEIHVPTSRIQDILHGRRKVTADTSVRLGRYFGVSDGYFLNMQHDIEIRLLTEKEDQDILSIQHYREPAIQSA